MGTRADFYIGRGKDARWLGSCAYDGYPGSGLRKVITAQTQEDFERCVAQRLTEEDGTKPEAGWPWPWTDSRTTDFAYAWDDGRVFISCFGYSWRTLPEWEEYERAGTDEVEPPEGKRCVFPDMTAVQKVTYGPRSGVLVFTFPREPGE